MELREYQKDAIDFVKTEWGKGNKNTLLVAATGMGKTIIFLSLLDNVLKSNQRGLIIAHRSELISQPIERMQKFFPYLANRSGVVMARQNEYKSDLIVATVQTLASDKRLNQVLDYGKIDYIVTDEAHHATASTYTNLYERLRSVNPDLKHLGVTATPFRSDEDGLSRVFDSVAAKYTIDYGIKNGYLSPVRFLSIQTGISLNGVKTQAGDFNQKQLKKVFEVDNCFELVVDSHQKYATGRKAIAYTISVDGAYTLAEKFNKAGIKAIAADGSTNRTERAKILSDFTSGDYEVLCNCALFTEGLDVPEVSAIHQVRPTKSDTLYTQIIGRALRIYPNKNDALILDYASKTDRNVAMLGDILGTPLDKKEYINTSKNGDNEEADVDGGFVFDAGGFNFLNGDPMELVAKELNYIKQSPWVWHRDDNGNKSLGLGKASDGNERILLLKPSDVNGYDLFLIGKREGSKNFQAKKFNAGVFDDVMREAEEIANRWGNPILAKKDGFWRDGQATERQVKYAKRLGAKIGKNMTKGKLAKVITHQLALNATGGLN